MQIHENDFSSLAVGKLKVKDAIALRKDVIQHFVSPAHHAEKLVYQQFLICLDQWPTLHQSRLWLSASETLRQPA
jgi:hypothetical protein